MTRPPAFSDDELNRIADRVWGDGLYSPAFQSVTVACPACGRDVSVLLSGRITGQAPQFSAKCGGCLRRGSSRAWSQPWRKLSTAELETIRDRHLMGVASRCPECGTPLRVRELPISGVASGPFDVRCERCLTHGQVNA